MSTSFKTWAKNIRKIVTVQYLKERLDIHFVAEVIRRHNYETKNQLVPWINPEMTAILENMLKPDDVGFEFGSGSSTIWLAKKVKKLYSVENNHQWYKIVKELLVKNKIDKKVRIYDVGEADEVAGIGKVNYLKPITEFKDEYFDFCFVDGLFRDECIEQSIKKLKRGGVLIVDNADNYFPKNIVSRSVRYKNDNFSKAVSEKKMQNIWRILAKWRCVWTSTAIQDTVLWIKP